MTVALAIVASIAFWTAVFLGLSGLFPAPRTGQERTREPRSDRPPNHT